MHAVAPMLEEQRDCVLYYVDVLDVTTNYTTVRRGAYVGETEREPFTRFLEHLYGQPFGDIIVGPPRVDPRVFPDKDAVWEAEREAIERLRPQYNYEWNLDNPERIPIPEARRQRDERDRAKGLPPRNWDVQAAPLDGAIVSTRWRPPLGVPRRSVSHRPSRLSPAWRRRRNVLTFRASMWLVLTVALWWAAWRYVPLPATRTAGPSALAALATLTGSAPHWRRHRSLSRKSCRFLAGLAVAAAVMWLLLPALVHLSTATPTTAH